MFRYDRPQKGRYRQFHQFGIEVFGDDSPQVDAEVIYAAVDFLRQLPIHDVQLHLNSVGCRSCRPGYLRQLQDAARLNLASLCEDCRYRAEANPLRIFDCKHEACVAITQSFPRITDFLCPSCQDHFRRVQESLAHFGVSYDINSRLVRGLDYYTKTAFEITSGQLGAQNALLGGGRYNDLTAELGGPDVPGIGFAAGMERIILHLQDIPAERAAVLFLAFQNEALLAQAIALARRLWQEGYAVLLDYQAGNFKKQLKRADRAQAQYTLILGEEEMANKAIALKNMKTQEQILIQQAELIPWLKKNL
jgi:histidyl-tRNA synthetase